MAFLKFISSKLHYWVLFVAMFFLKKYGLIPYGFIRIYWCVFSGLKHCRYSWKPFGFPNFSYLLVFLFSWRLHNSVLFPPILYLFLSSTILNSKFFYHACLSMYNAIRESSHERIEDRKEFSDSWDIVWHWPDPQKEYSLFVNSQFHFPSLWHIGKT